MLCKNGDKHSLPSHLAGETGRKQALTKLCAGCREGWGADTAGHREGTPTPASRILEDLGDGLTEVLQEKTVGQGLWINSANVEEDLTRQENKREPAGSHAKEQLSGLNHTAESISHQP